MFNCSTKKMIVGSTSATIFERFKSHLLGHSDKISKNAAKYVKRLGLENWIIIPVTYETNENIRRTLEGYWARRLKDYIINNPIELSMHKITKRPNLTKSNCNKLKRDFRNTKILDWKKQITLIRNTTIWQS